MSWIDLLTSVNDVFSSGQSVVTGGVYAAGGVFATAGFRYWTSKERVKAKSDEVFAGNLLARTQVLEKDNDRLRREHDVKDELHDKEITVARHEARNAQMCFNSLLLLTKRIPDAPPSLLSIIQDIEEMRLDFTKREDKERLSLEEWEKSIKLLP